MVGLELVVVGGDLVGGAGDDHQQAETQLAADEPVAGDRLEREDHRCQADQHHEVSNERTGPGHSAALFQLSVSPELLHIGG
jgi:hypothetical protein